VTASFAVVGTSFGCLTHVRAIQAAGHEVRVLVGRDPVNTSARAERFGIPRAVTALADALEDVDAVVVATPPRTHAALVFDAVQAGKHVLCEKPFAANVDEARRMLAAAEAAGVVHALGTEFRFAPGQALLARAVRSGLIGEPRLVTFLLHIPMLAGADAGAPEWWNPQGGGGWLAAQATHEIDQIRTTVGEFASVSASLPHVVGHAWNAEDAYLVQFLLHGGAAGIMQSVASDRGPMLFVRRVVGTRGTAWTEGDRVRVADIDGTRGLELPGELAVGPSEAPPADLMRSTYELLHASGIDFGPYTRLYETFGARIEGRAVPADPVLATFADGVASMAVIDAIRRSASVGLAVNVEQ